MATMDVDACIVDTNVLVYSTVSGNPWHQQAREWLAALQSKGHRLCVTTQILREYLVVLTRGKNIHDANIVAVMLTHGVRRLATYNQADFQRFDEIVLEAAPVKDPGNAS